MCINFKSKQDEEIYILSEYPDIIHANQTPHKVRVESEATKEKRIISFTEYTLSWREKIQNIITELGKQMQSEVAQNSFKNFEKIMP